jgi:tetratricopeptide (TPR) repeat protein
MGIEHAIAQLRVPHPVRSGLVLTFLCAGITSTTQEGPTGRHARAWADSVYRANDNRVIPDAAKALPLLDSVMDVFLNNSDTCRAARVNSWRSHCFEVMGRTDSAVAAAQQGLRWFGPACDSLVLMSIHVNLTNAWLALGEFRKVKELTEASLRAWNARWPYSVAHNGLYTNRAIALANLNDHPGALQAFRDVLANARKEGIASDEKDAMLNLSALFGMMAQVKDQHANLDSSYRYQKLAMALTRKLDDKNSLLILYSNAGVFQKDRLHYKEALAYLDSAHVLSEELQNLEMAVTIAEVRSECLFLVGMPDSAYKMMLVYKVLKNTLLDTEKVKAIADMQEKYESEKKAKEILGLTAQNLESELEKSRVKRTRNIYLFAGIGVLVMAGGLWNRLRYVRRSRAAIQKEKDRSEELLLNILPYEVAAELKAKGAAEAVQIDHVTVLFTDFKGFTAMSEQLSPRDLVRDLNECFSAFDRIAEKHGIEKIKTIGDAYMAAGGLPTPNTTHATGRGQGRTGDARLHRRRQGPEDRCGSTLLRDPYRHPHRPCGRGHRGREEVLSTTSGAIR